MAYTPYTKTNGSIRLVIDRMNLVICVICFVLLLMLSFVGGYLAGFNSRAARMASAPQPRPSTETNPRQQEATPPSAPEEPSSVPVDTASVMDEQPLPDASSVPPTNQEATSQTALATTSLADLYWQLASAEEAETARREVYEAYSFEEGADEEQVAAGIRSLRDRARRSEQGRPPERVALPPSPPVSEEGRATPGRYTVQVGAYRQKDNADRMLARVRDLGYEAEQVYTWFEQGNPVYCVWIEQYDEFDSAQMAAAQYREWEGEDAVAVRRIIR